MDIHIGAAERGNEKEKERIGRGRALMRGHNEVGGWHRLASLDCPQDPDRISPRSSPRRASRPFSTSDIPPQPLRPQEPSQADTKPIRAKRWEHYHIAFFAEILTTVYTHNHHVWGILRPMQDFLHSFLFFSLTRKHCLQLASKRERDGDIIIDIAGGSDDGLGPFSKPCIRLSDRARATTTGREKEGKSYGTNLYVISCEKKEFHAETGSFKVKDITNFIKKDFGEDMLNSIVADVAGITVASSVVAVHPKVSVVRTAVLGCRQQGWMQHSWRMGQWRGIPEFYTSTRRTRGARTLDSRGDLDLVSLRWLAGTPAASVVAHGKVSVVEEAGDYHYLLEIRFLPALGFWIPFSE
ncbi:hypothetical protein ALC56_08666 [Trachymyrmex septentrionalis]|uniref:Uncharacterized protein n=1 Tax=Trachymyrmex septentrionalis TaxID=34720 RepID=A0A195F8C9_9HYME|nr:hypothetical protein ALC56_08666 [Trachymyrmex septentrionalis]